MVLPAVAVYSRETVTGTLIADVPLEEMSMDFTEKNFEIFFSIPSFHVLEKFSFHFLQSEHFRASMVDSGLSQAYRGRDRC